MIKMEDYSTPVINNKIAGSGDYAKNSPPAKKRVPVPSSRKFGARIKRDDEIRIKLEKALNEYDVKPVNTHVKCLKKASTVAEITPTRAKVKKQNKATTFSGDDLSRVTLLATPRPLEGQPSTTRRCPRDRNVCTVYRRLLLNAWRRSRANLAALTDSSRRQRDQITQLEIQVNVLKSLQTSESQKRHESQTECNLLKIALDDIKLKQKRLQEECSNIQKNYEIAKNSLYVAQNEIKVLSEEINNEQVKLKKKREEKATLQLKLINSENQITELRNRINHLQQSSENYRKNLDASEASNAQKRQEIETLRLELKDEEICNSSLRKHIHQLEENKITLEEKIDDLHFQLSEYVTACESLQLENESIRTNIEDVTLELNEEKNKTWWKNTRDFAVLSLAALDQAAHIALPAYL